MPGDNGPVKKTSTKFYWFCYDSFWKLSSIKCDEALNDIVIDKKFKLTEINEYKNYEWKAFSSET